MVRERADVETAKKRNKRQAEPGETGPGTAVIGEKEGKWTRRLKGLAAIVAPCLVLLAYLTVVDLPCFRARYVHWDGVRNWLYLPPPLRDFRDIYQDTIIDQGRPLLACLENFYWSFVPTVSAASLIRVLAAAHIAIGGSLFFFVLKKNRVPPLHAALLTCLLVSLPGYQSKIVAGLGASTTLALVLAMVAALVCHSVERWFAAGHRLRDIVLAIVVFSLLFASLFIYQPFTMTFWGTLAAPLLFRREEGRSSWKDRIVVPLLLCGLAMGLYFVYLRLTPHLLETQVGEQFRSHDTHLLATSPGHKLAWFTGTVLPILFNLWHLKPTVVCTFNHWHLKLTVPFTSVTILLVVLGLLVRWLRSAALRTPGGRWRRVLDATLREAALVALVLLSFSPNLLSGGEVVATRTMVGLYVAVLLVLYAAMVDIFALLPAEKYRETAVRAVLAAAAFYGTIVAQTNAFDFAHAESAEYAVIKSLLAQPNFAQVQAIHFTYLVNPRPEYDEWGVVTSMSGGHGRGMVQAAMYELGMAERVKNTPITFGTEPISTGIYDIPNMPNGGKILIINLQTLAQQLLDIP